MTTKTKLKIIILVVWVALIIIGLLSLNAYDSNPGASGVAPPIWPAASSLSGPSGRPLLLFFLHPNCPCSRASLRTLESIMARAQNKLQVRVLMVCPSDLSESWSKSDLFKTVKEMPGVTSSIDTDGREAILFGAKTSGHCLLYDAKGRLAFQGGITLYRAHEGDNEGKAAILNSVEGRDSQGNDHTQCLRANTYGCALFDQGRVKGQNQGK